MLRCRMGYAAADHGTTLHCLQRNNRGLKNQPDVFVLHFSSLHPVDVHKSLIQRARLLSNSSCITGMFHFISAIYVDPHPTLPSPPLPSPTTTLPSLKQTTTKKCIPALPVSECARPPTPTMTHVGDVSAPLPWLQARYRKEHAQQRSAPSLPLVENLLKDNTDGCALTTLLHFYCSQAIRLEGRLSQLSRSSLTFWFQRERTRSIVQLAHNDLSKHNILSSLCGTKVLLFPALASLTTFMQFNKECVCHPFYFGTFCVMNWIQNNRIGGFKNPVLTGVVTCDVNYTGSCTA